MVNIEEVFQPLRRVKIFNKNITFYFKQKDSIRIQEGSPDKGKHTVPLRLARLHFVPNLGEEGEYEVFPTTIGSAVVPILNKSYFILEVRPPTYYSYSGRMATFGGILKKGWHLFANALNELGEELVLYDLKEKELLTFDFNKRFINYHTDILEKHGFTVNSVRFLDYLFYDFNDTVKIKSVYDTGDTEESSGFVEFNKEPPNVDVYYPLVILDKLNLENLLFIHQEMGGEVAVLLHYKQIPLIRPSYFINKTHKVLLKISKNIKTISHKYI